MKDRFTIPISWPVEKVNYAKFLMDGSSYLRGLVSRKLIRRQEEVQKEYNNGHWNRKLQILENKGWEASLSLHEFIIQLGTFDEPPFVIGLVEGNLYKVRAADYYDYRIRKLAKVLFQFVKEGERLVELGCGYGYNLFGLIGLNKTYRLAGYDRSDTAITTAKSIASRFDASIFFNTVDLVHQDLPVQGDALFTYYCMEQLKYHTKEVLTRMISWKPSQVIHLEPVVEFYRPFRARDLLGIGYIRWKDYQDKLFSTLCKLEKEGRVRILDSCRLGYASNGINEASLIRWCPV